MLPGETHSPVQGPRPLCIVALVPPPPGCVWPQPCGLGTHVHARPRRPDAWSAPARPTPTRSRPPFVAASSLRCDAHARARAVSPARRREGRVPPRRDARPPRPRGVQTVVGRGARPTGLLSLPSDRLAREPRVVLVLVPRPLPPLTTASPLRLPASHDAKSPHQSVRPSGGIELLARASVQPGMGSR
ncbi:hypothetical protein CDD83_4675 [Cordyceps sp. RAO-2017]|nr:hypothetical protein CDD83_4675 [Cordyceps sp. RAO-2017]